ncbi:MAG TPA: uroporphyrinogen decarboxylase family protein [bacterium]|nr:uroporphyrinogen decarboxylase family protein [bacterium]HPP29830.1 uroporphyrinogen decarboxylase family protein [bacterium]
MEKYRELKKRYDDRIEERKRRLKDFWDGKDIGRPPLSFIPYSYEPRQIFDDVNLQMEKAYRYFTTIMELPGDNIPVFWPDMGTVCLASLFGGELIREGNGHNIWIKPAFTSTEELRYIEAPDLLNALVKEEFDRCRRWRDLTDGFGYIAPPDMQGPVNLAILVMDANEFFVGMYTEPELIHKLLRLCTEVISGVLDMYRREFGDAFVPVTWPYIWFPDGMGVSLTQDSLPFLSPELYRKFELPYVKDISERNGGVFVHCCGKFEHNLEVMKEIPGLKGIDASYPLSHIEKIVEVLGMDIVITPNLNSKGIDEFPSYERYVEHLIKTLPDVRFWYILPADSPESHFNADATIKTLKILKLDHIAKEFQRVITSISSNFK